MMYLIGQLAVWLLLTALFAALAGWAFAAEQAAPADERRAKDRDRLVSDLSTLASGEARSEGVIAPDTEAVRSLTAIREARVAELERSLQEQRARADSLAAELAELQRNGQRGDADAEELQRLRAQVAAHEEERARIVDAEIAPVASTETQAVETEDAALQAWRLRYFEQRVKYLESTARAASPAPAAPDEKAETPIAAWRAREAEARAHFLADELRRSTSATPEAAVQPAEEPASPFAADADVDVLLRWRMLYLERRVAHLQAQSLASAAAAPLPEPAATPVEAGPDPDRWKWRARYLEARVRHLEQRPATSAAALMSAPAEEAPPPPPPVPQERPAGLPAAQGGAPDDFTLIDSISPLQQSSLYSLGIYHFDQIAAWSPGNVAWVDSYLRLHGRIHDEEWIEQAADLAREGPDAARRQIEEEDA